MDSELLKILLGGGGGAGVVYVVIDYLKNRRKDRLVDEDTALSRLREDYGRKKDEARKTAAREAWYRQHYYIARDRIPSDRRDDLPAGPPSDMY